jgi:hypothetical protein
MDCKCGHRFTDHKGSVRYFWDSANARMAGQCKHCDCHWFQDETWRSGDTGRSPWFVRYPLRELMLTRFDCEDIITAQGWPLPSKSACKGCPHRTNEEWRDLKAKHPEDFAEAVELEKELQANDELRGESGVWLHHSRVNLADADLDAPDRKYAPRQCGLGAGCWT